MKRLVFVLCTITLFFWSRAAFARLGSVVLVKSHGGSQAGAMDVYVKSLDTGTKKLIISHKAFPSTFVGPAQTVKPSPDGNHIALFENLDIAVIGGGVSSGMGGRCWVWNRKTRTMRIVSTLPTNETMFDWLNAGPYALVHDDNNGWPSDRIFSGTIGFFDARKTVRTKFRTVGQLLLAVPSGRGDGAIEVTYSQRLGSRVYLRSLSGKREFHFRWKYPIVSIAQSPDGRHFLFFDNSSYFLVNSRGKTARKFRIPRVRENFSVRFKFNPRGTMAAILTDYTTGEPHVNNNQQLWTVNVASGRLRKIAEWQETFLGSDLAVSRELSGWMPDNRSVVLTGTLYYGREKPADSEHDWYRIWSCDVTRRSPKRVKIFDSGKGWDLAAWIPGR